MTFARSQMAKETHCYIDATVKEEGRKKERDAFSFFLSCVKYNHNNLVYTGDMNLQDLHLQVRLFTADTCPSIVKERIKSHWSKLCMGRGHRTSVSYRYGMEGLFGVKIPPPLEVSLPTTILKGVLAGDTRSIQVAQNLVTVTHSTRTDYFIVAETRNNTMRKDTTGRTRERVTLRGFALVRHLNEDAIYIDVMCAKGAGKDVHKRCVQLAKDINAKYITISALYDAIPYWTKLGYSHKLWGCTPTEPHVVKGNDLNGYHMTYCIDATIRNSSLPDKHTHAAIRNQIEYIRAQTKLYYERVIIMPPVTREYVDAYKLVAERTDALVADMASNNAIVIENSDPEQFVQTHIITPARQISKSTIGPTATRLKKTPRRKKTPFARGKGGGKGKKAIRTPLYNPKKMAKKTTRKYVH